MCIQYQVGLLKTRFMSVQYFRVNVSPTEMLFVGVFHKDDLQSTLVYRIISSNVIYENDRRQSPLTEHIRMLYSCTCCVNDTYIHKYHKLCINDQLIQTDFDGREINITGAFYYVLTHYGLLMAYSIRDFGQCWMR